MALRSFRPLPSPDGRHVALGVSLGGSEAATGYVAEVASGRLLADRLLHVPYAAPAWLPDGSGFFYNRFAGRPMGDPSYYNDRSAWLNRVGTAQSANVRVVATAHVRGGGEYGRAWHEGGMKATKPNTWRTEPNGNFTDSNWGMIIS